MKYLVGQSAYCLVFLFGASLLLAACASGGGASIETDSPATQQQCSASLVTLDGNRIELIEITSETFLVSPLIPSTFGAMSVELKSAAVEKAILAQGTDLHEIKIRDLTTLTGFLSGSLAGRTGQGDQAIEWKTIREATIACDPAELAYVPPQGVAAVFYDDTGGNLPIYGLIVVQSYCTPSGEPVNGYQQCINGSEIENVLRVNVTQDDKVYIEYEIPLEYLTAMSWSEGVQYQSPMLELQTLRGEFHTAWALRPEGSMMYFEGENASGTWKIVPSGDFRVDFPQAAPPNLVVATPETVGSCTLPSGESFTVRSIEAGPIQLNVNENPQEIAWEDIRDIKLYRENSWLLSDAYQSTQFWQPVEIMLVDGAVIEGEAYLEDGFVTVVRPDGIRMNIPLYGLAELAMGR